MSLCRPQALRREIFEVALYAPHNPDGSRNLFNVGQNVLVSLMEVLSEVLEKVGDQISVLYTRNCVLIPYT